MMNPVKIIMVGPNPNKKGGIATLERNILRNATDNRYQYSMHVARPDGSFLIKLLLVPIYTLFFFVRVIFCKYTIVHIHTSENWGFYRYIPFVLLSKLRGLKIIIHPNACEFHTFYNRQNTTLKSLVRYILNQADCIIAVSEEWAEVFKSISKSRVAVVYNFINVPEDVQYNSKSKVISIVGELEKRKGYYDLIRIIPEVITKHPEISFVFCGNGEIDQVKQELTKYNIGESVKVMGWLEKEQITEILKDTLVFVLPSYNEGMPLAILEAMSFGIPIVSTRVGGIPSLVEDGKNGLLIEPGDLKALLMSINMLLHDDSLRTKMSKNNHQRIQETFGAERNMRKIYQIYDEVI